MPPDWVVSSGSLGTGWPVRLKRRACCIEGATVGITTASKTNIVAIRTLTDEEALARIIGKRLETSMKKLADEWRWSSSRVQRRLTDWSSAGHIDAKKGLRGRVMISVPEPVMASVPVASDVPTAGTAAEPVASAPAGRQGQAAVALPEPPPSALAG